jgi:hypothetical protein
VSAREGLLPRRELDGSLATHGDLVAHLIRPPATSWSSTVVLTLKAPAPGIGYP